MDRELEMLTRAMEDIEQIAADFELDFFPMRFELVPANIMYTYGAYGMPTRFAHWSFGKAYYKLKTQYDYNLNRIYELVVNTNPCYAFLLEGNSLVQNKLVMAHVLGHSDFFKNNAWFSQTNRKIMETMAVHSARIKEYEEKYGAKEVEIYLDAVLAIQEHVDYSLYDPGRKDGGGERRRSAEPAEPYQDLLDLGQKRPGSRTEIRPKGAGRQQKDLLLFLMEHGPKLEDWQRDLLSMIREEMLYFWPQLQTKIINEGWATYWHTKIMRTLDLDEAESLEYARLTAQVLATSDYQINPYHVGYSVFQDLEQRKGTEAIFEARAMDNDLSFLRNYLTRELCEKLNLYLYQKIGHQWMVAETDWPKVRDGLIRSLDNGGYPYIVVEDGDYRNGELYLRHCYEGWELDIPELEKTLPSVFLLWGRPVHLETIINDKSLLFTYDGKRTERRLMD